MENKTISLQELMFAISIQSKYLPTKIEYHGKQYHREGSMVTYEDDDKHLLEVSTIELATGGYVKVIEEQPTSNNDALINKIVDKIDDLKDELSNIHNAIDDIDIRYQIDEANERADNLEYEIGELEDLVNELRGE